MLKTKFNAKLRSGIKLNKKQEILSKCYTEQKFLFHKKRNNGGVKDELLCRRI